MSRQLASGLRHQVLLRTAKLQQASVQLQLDRLSAQQSVRLADWLIGVRGGPKGHWMTGIRLFGGLWRTGAQGLLATALARWIQQRKVS